MKKQLALIFIAIYSQVWICGASGLIGHDDPPVDLPLPHIVIVGATGVGKSSLASVLIGESPLCKNCTFPVCPEGGASCTNDTSYAAGPWLGTGPIFTIVDTPGFQDSDDDDSYLIDQMMSVLKETVKSANTLLLLLKGTDMRLDASLQQMLREMEALFGEEMWEHVVIGVSFWPYDQYNAEQRNKTCALMPEYCHDENWFMSGISSILEAKFHVGRSLPFAFIDSWAKHPLNIDDPFQQEAFARETEILWQAATSSEEFVFKSVQDILNENHQLKLEVAYLRDALEGNITEMKQDITDLRIQQGHTEELYTDLSQQLIDEAAERLKGDEGLNLIVQETQLSLQSAVETVNSNTNRINEHDGRLGAHDGELAAMNGRIGSNEANINNLYAAVRDAHVGFAVQSNYYDFPYETFVTYDQEFSDTHNAMDPGSGTFYAPFNGVYAFLYSTQMYCYYNRGELFAYRNDEAIAISQCFVNDDTSLWHSTSVNFALSLNAGDRVRIYSGTQKLDFKGVFIGFLMQRF